MGAMDTWDVTLLIVAGYLAVLALVRLMTRQRDQLLDNLREQIANERKRKEEEAERAANTWKEEEAWKESA
jgi:hypothetical protein